MNNTLTQLSELDKTSITEDKILDVIENFTLCLKATPLDTLSLAGLQTMKALTHIDDKGFSVQQYQESTSGYPSDFQALIFNVHNNQHYADWMTHINKNTEFVISNCTQLDCFKQFHKGSRLPLIQAMASVDIIFFDFERNKEMKNFKPIIQTLSEQVHNKIWGHLTVAIHPIKNHPGFVARLVLTGRGKSTKSALEIWTKSTDYIKF